LTRLVEPDGGNMEKDPPKARPRARAVRRSQEDHRVTITTPKRLGALALAAAFAIGACSGSGATTAPASGAPASDGSASEAPAAELPACLSFADMYALVGPESTGFASWADGQEIATALGSTNTFPDLPLSITAPGEESGTFDSYVELVIAGPAEARGIPEEEWTTRPDYTSSSNDNAIIEGITGSAGSFGWVGFAFYEENLDTVRAFQISEEPGGTCVEPTSASIADNSYPISRDLYIYVNKAKATANPAVTAYVDFYLADGTISSVLETVPYVNLAPDALAASQAAWTAGSPGNADPNGTIFVSGSSTVEPISGKVAEDFKAANAGFDYTVEGPGTGDGFAKFCAGETDISDASRPIKDEEAATCTEAGIEFIELKVAIDGIAVLTQK
jgi:ABC-type phosphate transport system substrate-binding protein